MFTKKSPTPLNQLADQATHSAGQALQATQHKAYKTLDKLADRAQEAGGQVVPLLDRASAFAQRSVGAVRDSAQQLGTKAWRASDRTMTYVKDEPVKAVLIAATTGAALVALASLMRSSPAPREQG